MAGLEIDLVREALGVARKNGFAEVELGVGTARFSARLEPAPVASRVGSSPFGDAAAEPTEPPMLSVTATLVGYYRAAAMPLEVGLTIAKGDVVAVIAALGIANDVESKVSGEVVEVLVQPNQPVEYGQALALVKPL